MTLTLKDIPVDVGAALHQRAQEQHKPVDQVAVDAMKMGLGIGNRESNKKSGESLAASIRARFAPLGGIELAETARDPMPDPLELGE